MFDFLLKKDVSALETDTENGYVDVIEIWPRSLTLYPVGIYTTGCVITNQAPSWNTFLNVFLGISAKNY
jgi:hypothetical protein